MRLQACTRLALLIVWTLPAVAQDGIDLDRGGAAPVSESCDPATLHASEWIQKGRSTCKQSPFRHPLLGIELLPGGRVPLLDVKDSERGGRYALMSSVVIEEDDGDVERHASKVVELEREKLGSEEVARGRAAARVAQLLARPRPKVGPRLLAALEAAGGKTEQRLAVTVRLHRERDEMIQQQMDRAIALGRVTSRAEAIAERQILMEIKRERIAAHLKPWVERLGARGAEVSPCALSPCLHVEADPEVIASLLDETDLKSIDLAPVMELSDDPGPRLEGPRRSVGSAKATMPVDNLVLDEIHDTYLLVENNHDGDRANPDVTCAIAERTRYRNYHLALKEGSGSSTRIRGMYDCRSGGTSSDPCQEVNGWPTPEYHATRVSGVVFADFRDDQSPLYTTDFEQDRRSAVAHEARCYLYRVSSSNATRLQNTWAHIADRSPAPEVVNMSHSHKSSDYECLGTDDYSIDVNEILYENGILAIKSAGNNDTNDPDGSGSSTNCNVGSPGSAIGAFTVAKLGGSVEEVSNMCAPDLAQVTSGSSWGGNANEGAGRSIVDMAAYGASKNRLCYSYDGAEETCRFGGTSASTPYVTSSALAYIDYYVDDRDEQIRDPGMLYANLLLMGDRASRFQTLLTAGYDPRYGAGRLRMRPMDSAGMDSPSYVYDLTTCIDHGQSYTFTLNNGNPVSNSVDVANVVLYWYDPRHMDGDPISDIDLELRVGETFQTVIAESDSPTDNKERLFVYDGAGTPLGGEVVHVGIKGVNVPTDDVGCGTNSMRVYLALYLEENDRDDSSTGPWWNPDDCIGVRPQ